MTQEFCKNWEIGLQEKNWHGQVVEQKEHSRMESQGLENLQESPVFSQLAF